MVTLAIYDISDDRERLRVERLCRDAGLRRVQRSAFRGRIPPARRDSFVAALTRRAEADPPGETWDVQVYGIADDDFPGHVRLGAGGAQPDGLDEDEVIVV